MRVNVLDVFASHTIHIYGWGFGVEAVGSGVWFARRSNGAIK